MEGDGGTRPLCNHVVTTGPADTTGHCECPSGLRRINTGVVWWLEALFYKVGFVIASNPYKTIITSLIVCGVTGVGLINWHMENDYVRVWLPRGSRMRGEWAWTQERFPDSARVSSVIVEDMNVLRPQALLDMLRIYQTALRFRGSEGQTMDTLCVKSGPHCRIHSILELWSYNEAVIRNLSSADVLDAVNAPVVVSPVYRNVMDLAKILGGIQRAGNGTIVGARATTIAWFLERSYETKLAALEWEKSLIDVINDGAHGSLGNTYVYTARSFNDEGMGAVTDDVDKLSMGFALVLIYVVFTIGKFSLIEQKIFLALSGLFSIGLAILFTYGLGLGAGIMFGPIHQITPFMLLGIGVDDMFVIVQALKHLSPKERELPVVERIALTLRHAGVSITVTSVTDIVAFGIGASTVIPSLSTFCVYASIGVFSLYVLQATYFVACLTLDQRRIDAKRDACVLCHVHSATYAANPCHEFSIQHWFMEKAWGPLLTKLPVKILVILVTLGVAGVNVWSFTKLKHEFDYSMYIPSDSYTQGYIAADRNYFPDDGAFALVYCDNLNYYKNADVLQRMYRDVRGHWTVQSGTVHFWFVSFRHWLNETRDPDIVASLDTDRYPVNQKAFSQLLRQFISSKDGQGFIRYVNIDCKTDLVSASALTFRHKKMASSQANIDVMDDMRRLVDGIHFQGGGTCFAYNTAQYMFNETNKVIQMELYRNLAIAAVCVFLVTFVLIANIRTSILVFLCVVFTVVDVAGTLQFWDVNIDTASSVLLILCFGLSVDFSAHIGHCFMMVKGTKDERAKKTLITIGPAVFSGGFSTFLAFFLLVNSRSYGFTLFFRTFTSVVIFGLFHGLAFLPVVLSLVGPAPYATQDFEKSKTISNANQHSVKQNGVPPTMHENIPMSDYVARKLASGGHVPNGGPPESNVRFSVYDKKMDGEATSCLMYEEMSNGSMTCLPKSGAGSPLRPNPRAH